MRFLAPETGAFAQQIGEQHGTLVAVPDGADVRPNYQAPVVPAAPELPSRPAVSARGARHGHKPQPAA